MKWAGVFLVLASSLFADEATVVSPPEPEDGIRITFLPPPVENGVVTLGIFDQTGKLVRVLHKAASEKEFVVGLNGFITKWDGKDQAGLALPPAKYKMRGYMVGDMEVEGVSFHGNDWVDGEASSLYTKITALKMDGLEIKATFAKIGGGEADVTLRTEEPAPTFDIKTGLGGEIIHDGKAVNATRDPILADIRGDKLVIIGFSARIVEMEEGDKPVAISKGFKDQVWVIVETKDGREVRAYLPSGEFLRRLAYEKDEPQPRMILASRMSEQIFVVEENAAEQRYRSLVLESVEKEGGASKEPAISNWKVVEQKRILFCDSFEKVADELKEELDFTSEEIAKIETLPNPLFQDATTKTMLTINHDANGTFFQTVDGLPLTHITDTPGVVWSVMKQHNDGITVIQSNGAVMEEFLVRKPDNLMAFDAGECEIHPPGYKKPVSKEEEAAPNPPENQ